MKRILSCILMMALCFQGCFCLEPDAYGADYEKNYEDSGIYVNPFMKDYVTEKDIETEIKSRKTDIMLLSDEEEELPIANSAEEASAIIRKGMVARAETIKFKYSSSERIRSNTLYKIGEGALVHTGVPTEGDYLYFSFSGWMYYADGSRTEGNQYYTLTYEFVYFTNAEQEAVLGDAIDKVLTELDLQPTEGTPSKIKKVYDYITHHTVYDYDHLKDKSYTLKYSAYAALLNGTAVCAGYANLLYRMMLTLGIDCRIITGQANGGFHAWNIVKVGDYYYNVDATWDTDKSPYLYFLKCDENFIKHERGADDGNAATMEQDFTTEQFYSQYPMHETDYDGDFTEHSHYYDAGTLFSEATCTENGSVVYRCIGEDCDDYYFGVINAKGHSWNEGEIKKEASCSETGEASYICLVCGESKTDVIAALGHTEVVIAGYEATCTDSGLSDSSYCSVCDAVLEEQTEIAPLGHTVKEIVTPATLTKDGSYHYVCSVCDQAIMTTASGTSISHPASFTLSKNSYTYDGKVKNPTLTIKDSKGKVISSDYYKIQKTSGRKKVGTYSYKITFQGLYSGSKTISFKINPKGTSIASISKKSKGFTVKWKKLTTQTTGYQIRYSTSSKMTNTKTATISKNTTVSKTVSKLKSKKRYYVQVRTYKTVSGKKYYSDWSATKYVVTK